MQGGKGFRQVQRTNSDNTEGAPVDVTRESQHRLFSYDKISSVNARKTPTNDGQYAAHDRTLDSPPSKLVQRVVCVCGICVWVGSGCMRWLKSRGRRFKRVLVAAWLRFLGG